MTAINKSIWVLKPNLGKKNRIKIKTKVKAFGKRLCVCLSQCSTEKVQSEFTK